MTLKTSALAIAALLAATTAQAVPVIFEGSDQSAGSLAAAPNSQAASDAFDAATGGSLNLVDFDGNAAVGISFSDGTVENTPSCGFALCGGNTTSGGSFFLRQFAGINTITFDNAIDSFGAYFSGWQVGNQTITYDDGTQVVLEMPDDISSGMVFFGFVDAGASITSISYDASNDIVALDDIRFGVANAVAPIPLPAGGALMLAGLAAFGVMRRRK